MSRTSLVSDLDSLGGPALDVSEWAEPGLSEDN